MSNCVIKNDKRLGIREGSFVVAKIRDNTSRAEFVFVVVEACCMETAKRRNIA